MAQPPMQAFVQMSSRLGATQHVTSEVQNNLAAMRRPEEKS